MKELGLQGAFHKTELKTQSVAANMAWFQICAQNHGQFSLLTSNSWRWLCGYAGQVTTHKWEGSVIILWREKQLIALFYKKRN